jgi:hypothetical protein
VNTTALNTSAIAGSAANASGGSFGCQHACSDNESALAAAVSGPVELITNAIRWVQLTRKVPICLLISLFCLVLHYATTFQSAAEFHFGRFDIQNPIPLLTCHWLHWSDSHLFWDLVVFAIVGVLCEFLYPKHFWRTLLSSSILIPVLVMISEPQLLCYRGLSGLDSALVALLVTRLLLEDIRRGNPQGIAVFSIFLVLQFLKIAAEVLVQGNLFVTNGDFIPAPLAHLAGASIGCCIGLWHRGGGLARRDDCRRSPGTSCDAAV